jgi:hypothetical protein
LSPARAWRRAVASRLTQTLGLTQHHPRTASVRECGPESRKRSAVDQTQTDEPRIPSMRHLVTISANKLAWPNSCASCLGESDTTVTVKTRKITSRNLQEASWGIPYCSACKTKDDTALPTLGWFKSFWDTFTTRDYAVAYLSLHMTSHKFSFANKTYLEEFLRLNSDKARSEVSTK